MVQVGTLCLSFVLVQVLHCDEKEFSLKGPTEEIQSSKFEMEIIFSDRNTCLPYKRK